MTDRERALREVQIYNFACIEAALFCDTHPNDSQALEYLKKCTEAYEKAYKNYVTRFGMLTHSDISDGDTKWEWIKGPWPWENESEVER